MTRLYRVLDGTEDGWLFVPVEGEADSPAPDEDDGPTVGAEGDGAPAPGVPDAGDERESPVSAPTADEQSYRPIAVPREGHGDLDEAIEALLPGYLVAATLSWAEPTPRVEALTVQKRTLFEFADDVTNLFEAAQSAWAAASAAGEPMASRVTRGTDGQVNGVLYVFADADGGDRLAEFRSGRRPLEPLLERVNESAPDGTSPGGDGPSVSVGPGGIHVTGGDEPPPEHGLGHDREVFVLRPADGPFVVVLVTLRKGGTLANTVRDTYNCPRPAE